MRPLSWRDVALVQPASLRPRGRSVGLGLWRSALPPPSRRGGSGGGSNELPEDLRQALERFYTGEVKGNESKGGFWQGLGDLGHKIFTGAMGAIDTGRAAVGALASEGVEGIRYAVADDAAKRDLREKGIDGFQWSDVVQKTKDRESFVEQFSLDEEAWFQDLPGWAQASINFAGEMVTDPLTYLAGAKALDDAAKVARQITKPGSKFIKEMGEDAAKEAAARITLPGRGSSFLTTKELQASGLARGGLYIRTPGTGVFGRALKVDKLIDKMTGGRLPREFNIIPRNTRAGEALNRAARGIRQATTIPLMDNKIWQGAISMGMAGARPALRALAKSGDPERAFMGNWGLAAEAEGRHVGNAFGGRNVGRLNDILKKVAKDPDADHDLWLATGGDKPARDRLVRKFGNADLVDEAISFFDDVRIEANRLVDIEGRGLEFLRHQSDYTPRIWTDQAMREGAGDTLREGIVQARVYGFGPGQQDTFMGRKLIKDHPKGHSVEQQITDIMYAEGLVPTNRVKDNPYLKTKASEAFPAYLKMLSHQVGTEWTAARLRQLGIAEDLVANLTDPDSVTAVAAKMRAFRDLRQARKAARAATQRADEVRRETDKVTRGLQEDQENLVGIQEPGVRAGMEMAEAVEEYGALKWDSAVRLNEESADFARSIGIEIDRTSSELAIAEANARVATERAAQLWQRRRQLQQYSDDLQRRIVEAYEQAERRLATPQKLQEAENQIAQLEAELSQLDELLDNLDGAAENAQLQKRTAQQNIAAIDNRLKDLRKQERALEDVIAWADPRISPHTSSGQGVQAPRNPRTSAQARMGRAAWIVDPQGNVIPGVPPERIPPVPESSIYPRFKGLRVTRDRAKAELRKVRSQIRRGQHLREGQEHLLRSADEALQRVEDAKPFSERRQRIAQEMGDAAQHIAELGQDTLAMRYAVLSKRLPDIDGPTIKTWHGGPWRHGTTTSLDLSKMGRAGSGTGELDAYLGPHFTDHDGSALGFGRNVAEAEIHATNPKVYGSEPYSGGAASGDSVDAKYEMFVDVWELGATPEIARTVADEVRKRAGRNTSYAKLADNIEAGMSLREAAIDAFGTPLGDPTPVAVLRLEGALDPATKRLLAENFKEYLIGQGFDSIIYPMNVSSASRTLDPTWNIIPLDAGQVRLVNDPDGVHRDLWQKKYEIEDLIRGAAEDVEHRLGSKIDAVEREIVNATADWTQANEQATLARRKRDELRRAVADMQDSLDDQLAQDAAEELAMRDEAIMLWERAAEHRAAAHARAMEEVPSEVEQLADIRLAAIANLEAQAKNAEAEALRALERVRKIEQQLEAPVYRAKKRPSGGEGAITQRPRTERPPLFHRLADAEFVEQIQPVLQKGFREFGMLSQAPEELVEAMTAAARFNTPKGFRAVLGAFDRVSALWKSYAILSPGFHFRNLYGGIFNNWLHGMDEAAYGRYITASRAWNRGEGHWAQFKAASDANAKLAEAFEWAERLGVLTGGQTAHEVERSIGRRLNANPFSQDFALLRGSRRVGESTENFLRGSLFVDEYLKNGGDATEAFMTVVKYHFDYEDLSALERSVMRRIIPFYTWTRKNLPLQLEMLLRNPAKMNRYFQAKRSIEMLSEEEGIVPDYFHELYAIRLPWRRGGGHLYAAPDLPFHSLTDLLDPGMLFSQVNPIIKTPLEVWAGKQAFKGLPIRDDLIEPPEPLGRIPGLMPALSALGWAERHKDGSWRISEKAAYTIGQAMPLIARSQRLMPKEERFQQRSLTSHLSFWMGVGLRTNTKDEQERLLRSTFYELRDQIDRLEQLGYYDEGDRPSTREYLEEIGAL